MEEKFVILAFLFIICTYAVPLGPENYMVRKNEGNRVNVRQVPVTRQIQEENAGPPILAGSDVLGLGMDVRYDDFQGGKSMLFDWTNNLEQTFTFRAGAAVSYVTEDLTYAVPDQVTVRTIGTEIRTEQVFSRFDAYLKEKNRGFDKSVNLLIVKISTKMRNVERNLDRDDNVIALVEESVELFEASLSLDRLRQAIRPSVRADMLKAVRYPYQALPEAYMSFVEKYGTHFVSQVVCGAQIAVESQFKNISQEYLFDLMLSIGISIPAASISLDFDFGTHIQRKKYQSDSLSSMTIQGGLPDRYDLSGILAASTPQEVQATIDMINMWKRSIGANPVPFRSSVTPISSLFTDAQARDGMDRAISCFYNTDCYRNYLKNSLGNYS